MSKHIKKHAPEGAEYFQIVGSTIAYYKCDEEDNAYCWAGDEMGWDMVELMSKLDLDIDPNVHHVDSDVPWYFWVLWGAGLMWAFLVMSGNL